jgi:hypothetical protein
VRLRPATCGARFVRPKKLPTEFAALDAKPLAADAASDALFPIADAASDAVFAPLFANETVELPI